MFNLSNRSHLIGFMFVKIPSDLPERYPICSKENVFVSVLSG